MEVARVLGVARRIEFLTTAFPSAFDHDRIRGFSSKGRSEEGL
jgi:hypothetical protein